VQACATFLVCPGCLELLSADRRPIGRNNDGFFQYVRSCPVPLFVFVPISWLCESLLVVGWAAADGRPLLNQCPLVLGIPRLLCSWPTVWTARVGWPTIVCAVQLKHRKMKMGFVLIVQWCSGNKKHKIKKIVVRTSLKNCTSMCFGTLIDAKKLRKVTKNYEKLSKQDNQHVAYNTEFTVPACHRPSCPVECEKWVGDECR
jgi:hypothetical protein